MVNGDHIAAPALQKLDVADAVDHRLLKGNRFTDHHSSAGGKDGVYHFLPGSVDEFSAYVL